MLWHHAGFIVFILALLALDLGVFHREAREPSAKEALGWSAFWIGLGLAFTGFVYAAYSGHWLGIGLSGDMMSASSGGNDGSSAALKYLTAYLIEKSLSVDNVFVIAMIFGMLRVPGRERHRVLFWGILSALALRGGMIALGAGLLARFSWLIYAFGALLLLTGAKMLLLPSGGDPAGAAALALARRVLPVTEGFHGGRFWVRTGGRDGRPGALAMTPLFLALLAVEFTDLVFAVDSIPAVFAVTTDPFLVFTSNVFALLGLRSLYFALEGMMGRFHRLKAALALVMILVGGKMLAHAQLKALLGPSFNLWPLAAVALILAGGIAASLVRPGRS